MSQQIYAIPVDFSLFIIGELMKKRNSIIQTTVNLGLGTNILLAFLKTIIGIIGKSQALLADGINSTSDVVYYLIIKIILKQAGKPADKEHPYGHLQLESIASLVVGAFVLTTAVSVFWYSVNSVHQMFTGVSEKEGASIFALSIALFTVALKIFLRFYTLKAYKKTQNPTLKALASDHVNDIFASVSVTIGIVLSRMGLYWLDPLAGAVVAVFILLTGIDIIKDSSADLMDTIPDDDFKKNLSEIIRSCTAVKRIDDVGIHRFGPKFILNITVEIDGNMTVTEGDLISDTIEKKLFEEYGETLNKVNVHYHPPKI